MICNVCICIYVLYVPMGLEPDIKNNYKYNSVILYGMMYMYRILGLYLEVW